VLVLPWPSRPSFGPARLGRSRAFRTREFRPDHFEDILGPTVAGTSEATDGPELVDVY